VLGPSGLALRQSFDDYLAHGPWVGGVSEELTAVNARRHGPYGVRFGGCRRRA
jgi:hypothetical protein